MSNKKDDVRTGGRFPITRRNIILSAGAIGTAAFVEGLTESVAQQAGQSPAGLGGAVKFSVDASHIKLDAGNVAISDPALATTMARYGSDGVRKELGVKAKARILASEITIGPHGEVIISNPTFAKGVNDFLNNPKGAASDTNYCCDCNAYKCGK